MYRDLQFHTKSWGAGSRGLQEASTMFFDDAAAGVKRKGGRLVAAFGAEQRRVRGWLRRIARIIRGEINQNEIALPVGANEQGGVSVAIEIGDDLSGKVHADVENLVGVCEHKRKRRSEFEADGTGFRFQLWSKQAHGGLQHGIDVDGGQAGRSLTGKSEQARNQCGCAADLLPDSRGLELFL